MATFAKKVINFYNRLQDTADPRVKDWFLMSSPLVPLFIAFSYLYFVQKLGPQLMKNRPPFNLKYVLIIYNITQILMSAYLVEEAFRWLWLSQNYNFFCIEINYSNTNDQIMVARTVWLYHLAKLIDLLDTVFFVLRKKQAQASFLHVYHHSIIFVLSWVITKYYAGGHSSFLGTVNAFVHMVMYAYYLYTAWYPGDKNTIWWKKYLTQLQMIQFIVTGIHGALIFFVQNCNYPKFLVIIGIPQDIFMFVLFFDFYRKAYLKPKQKQQNNVSLSSKEKVQ